MLEFELTVIPQDRDNIKPRRPVDTVMNQIMVCGPNHAPHPLFSDEILGIAPFCRCAGFDLHKHDILLVFCHDVDFIAKTGPVSLPNAVSFRFQVFHRSILPFHPNSLCSAITLPVEMSYRRCKITNLHCICFVLAKIFVFCTCKGKAVDYGSKTLYYFVKEIQWLFDEDKEIQAAGQAEAAHQKSGVHAQR